MFVFECHSHNKNCLVMFLGQYSKKSRKRLTDDIQKAYREHLTPELVFILYPNYLDNEIVALLGDEQIVIDLKRQKHSPVYKVSFDEKATLDCKEIFEGFGSDVELDKRKLIDDIVNAGFHALMEKRANEVIVTSPSGTTFVKPSGKSREEFIYASQLARCNFEHQFIAMALLQHAPDLREVDSVYIDTSSISAIAESVIYYIKQFSNDSCKHVTYRSFSSYSGLENNITPDNVDRTWVIISASASTSLGQKLVREWHIDSKKVVTILSYMPRLKQEQDNVGNDVVFCIKNYSDKDEKSFSPTKVQVQGESFSAEVSSPDKVALLKKFKPNYIDDAIYPFYQGRVFSVNKCGYTLYVDYLELRKHYLDEHNKLDKEEELYKWILKTVEWTIPKNLSAIIYPENEQSVALLEDFKSVLQECRFNLDGIKEIKNSDQIAIEKIKNNAVLIISPAVSTAHIFVDVNRALRLANHTGMRTFATPFVVAPSEEQFKSVNTSLTQGTKGFKYNYLKFQKIFLSSKNLSPWDKELEVIKNLLDGQDDDVSDFWIERKEKLERRSEGLSKFVGIHSSDPDGTLDLAKDFVFWPDNYMPDDINHSAVFATVGSILQNLRDNNIDGHQLSSNIYKHAVLDPENFVRFNDPILQTCLWRCALPGELDYRRSEALSSDLQRIFTKIFQSFNSHRGVTAVDLLMALATRWIKVSSAEIKTIIESAERYLTEPYTLELVRYMKKEFIKK